MTTLHSGESIERTVDRPIGGQAVIEGVMIRSPERVATAVRRPDGTISVQAYPYVSLVKRVRGFGLPIFRGVVTFAEMTVLGFRTLNYSASVAMPDEQANDWKNTLLDWLITAGAIIAGLGLFLALPLAVASVFGFANHPLAYNFVAGSVRAGILLGYLWILGRVPDLRRVFAYHGAEHKAVFAYEGGEDLTVDAAREYSRFHPRCGTSFLLIVVFVAIVAYAVIDAVFAVLIGRVPTLVERIATHLLFLPVVAGASFEALKASGAYRNSAVVRALIAPGLWLQRLTTREPDDEQLEVAVVAARASLGLAPSFTLPTDSRTVDDKSFVAV